MAVIVAFGDSDTWGYDPATGDDSLARSVGPASFSAGLDRTSR